MSSTDTLRLDRAGALDLWHALVTTADALARDRIAVGSLVDQASDLLRRDRRAPSLDLRRAHEGVDRLAEDLRRRLDRIDAYWSDVAAIDALSHRIGQWRGTDNDPLLDRLVARRRRGVVALVGGDLALALRAMVHLADGRDVVGAVALARGEAHAARVDEVVAALAVSRAEAQAHVARIDLGLALVLDRGYRAEVAAVSVTMALTLDLDLDTALELAADHRVDPPTALGWMAVAGGIGVSVAELFALDGLVAHFATFDGAFGRGVDGKVSERDLEFVVSHPGRFAGPQIAAARAVLDHPDLRARLDTAAEHDEIVGGDGFGRSRPGDGIVSLADLDSFMMKARIHSALGEYAPQIDTAADAGGDPDGFYSLADFEAFLAERPDLPAEVRTAAQTIIDSGWFDRTWLEQHRDELAAGAAVVAGGTVIVLSGGAATPFVLGAGAAAAATAAAATTVTVNLSGDAAEPWDGVQGNAINGGVVGLSIVGLPASIAAVRSSAGLARAAAAAGAASDSSAVVAAGGLDLVLPERVEDEIHQVSGAVSEATGFASLAYTAVRSVRTWVVGPEYQEHVDALMDTVNARRQDRHLLGGDEWTREPKGYVESVEEAQEVLDAVREGRAEILGRTKAGHLVVEYPEVTGFDINTRQERIAAPTNRFLVKGTTRPSVVPANPDYSALTDH